MAFTLEEVEERLSCPHTESCTYRDVSRQIKATTRKSKLSLTKKCHQCHGQDHLMFDVTEYDASQQVEFAVGDEFTVEQSVSWFYTASPNDTCRITAIAKHPYRDKTVIGVVGDIDTESPYPATLVPLSRFQDSLSNLAITFE